MIYIEQKEQNRFYFGTLNIFLSIETLCPTLFNIAKHGEITTKFKFTGTGAQPHRNRKLLQFNNAHDCTALYFQQAIMTIGGSISIPFILTPLVCGDGDVTSQLISITMFMCGLATILQSLFGVR